MAIEGISERNLSVYNKNRFLFRFFKRVIDIIGSIIGLILISPFFMLCALYRFGENQGLCVYKQERIGQYGKKFKIYKFRSMVTDAERKLKENKELYQKYLNNNYKLEPDEDPRITKLGRFLRKTSIDELPQFINVFKGEMSLVGPRPIVEEELIREYQGKIDDFLSVKPGLTGYWQVIGRSDIGYPERTEIELFYVYNQSIWLDLKILFKTFVSVLLRKGAY
jgi:exopolysaccharide production protein ExoY